MISSIWISPLKRLMRLFCPIDRKEIAMILLLTEHMRADFQPLSLQEYESHGGYMAVRKAKSLSSLELIGLIKDSCLLGRGGAGFSTGIKMGAVPPADNSRQARYLVVNADEMEPGTFKDRWLLEGHPHQLLEGVMIGAHAISAQTAYIFLRGEYKLAKKRLEHALREAKE